jgi:hypothetical protein
LAINDLPPAPTLATTSFLLLSLPISEHLPYHLIILM